MTWHWGAECEARHGRWAKVSERFSSIAASRSGLRVGGHFRPLSCRLRVSGISNCWRGACSVARMRRRTARWSLDRTSNSDEVRKGQHPACESAVMRPARRSAWRSSMTRGSDCCGRVRSRHKVKKGIGDDWMMREASGLREKPPRASADPWSPVCGVWRRRPGTLWIYRKTCEGWSAFCAYMASLSPLDGCQTSPRPHTQQPSRLTTISSFAITACNGLNPFGLHSSLSPSADCRSACQGTVCSVEPRCLQGQPRAPRYCGRCVELRLQHWTQRLRADRLRRSDGVLADEDSGSIRRANVDCQRDEGMRPR